MDSSLWDNLCNQFGIVRNRTTSYHPQSNGLIERFHRQFKAAIMAHESLNPWTSTLPDILLGVRSANKELLGRSAAEMVYGTTLRLPGEFTEQYTIDVRTDLDYYSDKLTTNCYIIFFQAGYKKKKFPLKVWMEFLLVLFISVDCVISRLPTRVVTLQ